MSLGERNIIIYIYIVLGNLQTIISSIYFSLNLLPKCGIWWLSLCCRWRLEVYGDRVGKCLWNFVSNSAPGVCHEGTLR